MNARELRELRGRMGWSQDDLGGLLKATLGKGSSTTVGKWEKGDRPVPDDVSRFLAQVELEQAFPERAFPPDGQAAHREPPLDSAASSVEGGSAGDSAPPEPVERSTATAGPLPSLPGGGSYATVCEELWELVATGIGMVGAVTGSEVLRADGRILAEDKAALGKAYGKLAEQNATFRRMLLSATGGGAWLEVALVSGITFGKCYRSHASIGERKAAELAEQAELEGEVVDYGDDAGRPGTGAFPQATAA